MLSSEQMLEEMFKEPDLGGMWWLAWSRYYQISRLSSFPVYVNYFTSSDAASIDSTGSNKLDQTRISNLQEIIKPHPILANRMYFV